MVCLFWISFFIFIWFYVGGFLGNGKGGDDGGGDGGGDGSDDDGEEYIFLLFILIFVFVVFYLGYCIVIWVKDESLDFEFFCIGFGLFGLLVFVVVCLNVWVVFFLFKFRIIFLCVVFCLFLSMYCIDLLVFFKYCYYLKVLVFLIF